MSSKQQVGINQPTLPKKDEPLPEKEEASTVWILMGLLLGIGMLAIGLLMADFNVGGYGRKPLLWLAYEAPVFLVFLLFLILLVKTKLDANPLQDKGRRLNYKKCVAQFAELAFGLGIVLLLARIFVN